MPSADGWKLSRVASETVEHRVVAGSSRVPNNGTRKSLGKRPRHFDDGASACVLAGSQGAGRMTRIGRASVVP